MNVKVNYRLGQSTRCNFEIFCTRAEFQAMVDNPTVLPKEIREYGQPAGGSYVFCTDSQEIFMYDERTNTWRTIE